MPKSRYTKRGDGRYQVKVNVGKTAVGKTIYKTLYAATERELKEKESSLKAQLAQGVYVDGATQSLAQWSREWLKTYKNNVSYNTRAMYEGIVENHIARSDIAGMAVKDIKLYHLQQLINQKAEAGLSRTVEMLRCTLNQIFDAAVNNDMILKNPTHGLEMPRRERKEKQALTEDERAAVEAADFSPKQRAFVGLALYAGLRRGEILALSTDDINLVERTIRINKNLVIKNTHTEVKNSPKTDAGFRTVPIRQRLYAVLSDYINSLSSDILFPMKNGGYTTASSYAKFWLSIQKKIAASAENLGLSIDVSTLTAHILRHTFATDLFYSGIDVKAAQRLLGHSRVSTTLDIYTHCRATNDEIISMLDRLDNTSSF